MLTPSHPAPLPRCGGEGRKRSPNAGWRSHEVLLKHTSVSPPIAEDAPQRVEAVAPADFLTLLVGARIIRDRDFIDAMAGPGEFRGDLGLETETILLEARCNALNDVAAKNLVAGFHVGQMQIG